MGWDIDDIIINEIKGKILKTRYAGCTYSMAVSITPVIIRHRAFITRKERQKIVKLFPKDVRVEFQYTDSDMDRTRIFGYNSVAEYEALTDHAKGEFSEVPVIDAIIDKLKAQWSQMISANKPLDKRILEGFELASSIVNTSCRESAISAGAAVINHYPVSEELINEKRSDNPGQNGQQPAAG